MKSTPIAFLVGTFALTALVSVSHAQFADKRNSTSVYVQGGLAERDTRSLSAGANLPMNWNASWWGHPVTAHWDMSLSMWRSDRMNQEGSRNIGVLGVVPTLRFHSKSESPWFVEAGLGGYVSSKLYESREKRFSTAFNFGTHIGVGYFTGMHRENEWSVRLEHLSNASIKRPNPGENFVQFRYARHF